MKLYQAIAAALQARTNCRDGAVLNEEWFHRWDARLDHIARNALPSGSGIDNGTVIYRDDCKPDCIVLATSFHHMNDAGMYDGWTDHVVRVRPSFDGIALTVSGRNRNDIKDYLAEMFHNVLASEYEWPAE